MLQVKFFTGENLADMEDRVNQFLATIKSSEVKGIRVQHHMLIVEYEVKEKWMSNICADCQYWDDSGSTDAVIGVCQEHGHRKRFSCKACDRFKDIRR